MEWRLVPPLVLMCLPASLVDVACSVNPSMALNSLTIPALACDPPEPVVSGRQLLLEEAWVSRYTPHVMYWPPLAEMVEPVMKPASSEARAVFRRLGGLGASRFWHGVLDGRASHAGALFGQAELGPALAIITAQDAQGWFRLCGYRPPN